MQVYLIRHGESMNNYLSHVREYAHYLATRSEDPVLTERGCQQARLVAEHLAQSSAYCLTHLYASPMLRALQTAEPIARALGLTVEVWPAIHEHGGIFLGNPELGNTVRGLTGLSRAQIQERFPAYRLPDSITDKGWWFSGYEEIYDCEIRAGHVAQVLHRWAEERPDDHIGLVTHGTFVDRLLKALFRQEFATPMHYYHNNTGITRVDFRPAENGREPVVLRYSNRTAHLGDDAYDAPIVM